MASLRSALARLGENIEQRRVTALTVAAPPPPPPALRDLCEIERQLDAWWVGNEAPPVTLEEAQHALDAVDWTPTPASVAKPTAAVLIATIGGAGDGDGEDDELGLALPRALAAELMRWPEIIAREAVATLVRTHRFKLRPADLVAALEAAALPHKTRRSRAHLAWGWHLAETTRPELRDHAKWRLAHDTRNGEMIRKIVMGEI